MKIAAKTKRSITPPRDVVSYLDRLVAAPVEELVPILQEVDVWRWPRGDLHTWIPVIDRIDDVLEGIIGSYELSKPQMNPFTPKDRELVLESLRFTRLLLENNTSRKLYASFDRCYDLLCTSDMEILLATLYILLRPGQTYTHQPPIEAALVKKLTDRMLAFVHTEHIKEYAAGEPVDPKVTVTYFKTTSSSVDLSHITLDDTDQLYAMDLPVDDHLSALMSIRRKYFDDRELITTIHLIALADYLLYSVTAALEHAIFLYEPELVPKTAELLTLSDPIAAAAITCLDALIRNKTKLPEVISAIGINLNHGPLFTILRSIAKQERSYDVVDATMSLVGYLLEYSQHGNILTGAGILPILLDITGLPDARIVPRACGIIDNLVLGQLHGLQMFSNADGVNIIVSRIKDQVDNAQVEQHPLLSDEHARLYSMQPLQKLLRTVQSLMKASGASEGMRNLVDGELPKSIKRIFENNKHYGTRVFALAISVMTTFINNEPTSLSILQEMGLPQTLYDKLDEGVPATTESTIGNAISAICLNAAGLDLTKEHPAIIRNLIRTSIEEPEKPLDPDAGAVGMSMEELARHQQALRTIIENATIEQVKSIIDEAAKFEPPEDQLSDYHLDKIKRDGTVTAVTSNVHLVRLARTFRFLEGFTRDSTSCNDLIKEGLLPLLLSVLELPCIPVRFGTTEAATTFSHLTRAIGKHDHIKLAEAFIEAINKQSISLDAEKWAAFDKGEGMDPDFRKLRTVAASLTYFAEFLAGLTNFTHHRMMTSLLKVIKPEFLHRLGEIAQMALTQHAALKTPAPQDAELGFDTETHDNGKETGAKFLATRTYAMTTRFFRSILRMTFVKRVPDVTKSDEAKAIIQAISQIMNNSLSTPSLPGKEAETLVQAVCFNASLLFEDSRNSVLQLVLAPTYDYAPLIRAADELMEHRDVKILALLLSGLVNQHAVYNSPQLGLLPDPAKFLVELRHTLFPTIEKLWQAEWLTDAPADTIKLVAKTFLAVMAGDKEDSSDQPAIIVTAPGPAPIPVVQRRAPVTANPAFVDQLVDMGFSRGGSELALIRAHNNIAAATELILSQPHLYADVPDPEPAPPAAEPAAEEPAAAEEAEAPGAAEGEAAAPEATAADAEPAAVANGDIEMAIAIPDLGDMPEGAGRQIMEGLQQILAGGLNIPGLAPAQQPEDPLAGDDTDHKAELKKLREAAKEHMPKRALTLIDHSEDLVFVCGPAFPTGKEGYEYVLDQLKLLLPYDATKESAVSARLRMAVVLGRAKDVVVDTPPVELLCALPFEPAAKWNSAYLLLGEIAIAAAVKITESKLGDERSLIVEQADLGDLPRRLKQLSLQVVTDASVERTPLLTSLRMLAILSRSTTDLPYADILAAFKKPSPKLAGCQPLLALILRHAFEDNATLKAIMRREMQSWSAAGKVSDINHFVRQLKQAAYRSPTAFVEAANAECALVDPTPSTAIFHIRRKDTKDAEESDPFTETPSSTAGRSIIDLLLGEFSTAASAARENKEDKDNLAYAGMIMSILTELVGSYIPAKTTLLAALRQNKGKGIASLLTELDQRLTDPADSPGRSISKWQSAFLVGLCADIGITSDIKHVSEELVTVRRAVLEAITKAFKEPNTDLDQRYGRLAALGDLIHKLLTNRSHGIGRQDESATHMAKVMIEKNLVGTLTAATSEVDLNFPQVGSVLASLLRALELLSKISTKWGKAEKDKERQIEEDEDSEDSEDSDGDMSLDDEDEAQDLYRNSALGMLNNEMDDDSEEEDDEEEDEMMQYEEEAMEDMMDEEDDDTEPSDMEDGSDIDMEDEDMENEWTDEEDGEEGDIEMDGEDVDDGMIEREAILAPPGEEDEEDADQWDEEDDIGGGTDEEEDYGEEYDDYMMDEYDEYDDPEVDFYDDGLEAVYGQAADTTGPWGWSQQGPRLSYMGDPVDPVRPDSASHPLIAPPAETPRRRPRDYTSRAGVNDLLRDIQQMRTPESMAALDALMTSHRANGQVPVQIDLHADQDHIGIRIDGRTFNLTRPGANTTPPDITSEFLPRQTMSRWLEEWNIIPGCDLPEQSARLVMHIVNRLMPEAKKTADKAAEDAAKKAAEDEKKAEEERKVREEKEKKEKEEAEQKKAEEDRLKAEAEAEAARVAAETAQQAAEVPLPESRAGGTPVPTSEDVDMEASNEAGPSTAAAQAEPAAPAETLARTIIQIHGRDVDITDTGIDLEFLQALPDELRADVVEQHMRERDRVQRPAATGGADPESELSADFLNALPPEIQAELLAQEAMEGARRQAAQAPPPAALPDPTPAVMPRAPGAAHIPPTAGLNRALIEQARRRLEQLGEEADLEIPGAGRLRDIMNGLDDIMAGVPGMPRMGGARRPAAGAARPHREALQLLDKHGIASLVRLLFFPGGSSEDSLYNILIHLCENTTTRSDLLNLLISVVQDGSGDLLAVDRSFQQMTIKAMATPKVTPKVRISETPGAAASTASVPIFSHLSPEHVPAFIAQRCFDALLRIVRSNTLAINFFLTEHEQPVGLKKVAGKKGKGKEKLLPQTRFPIVILLGLLDRPVLLKTSAMMEAFTGLLAVITRPLATLKEIEASEAEKNNDGDAVPEAAAGTAPAPTPARPTTATPGPSAATPAAAAATPAPAAEGSTPAKPLALTKAPAIPAPVLRLVVNCLMGDCSSQTFSNSLGVMRNLSSSPEAKEVILSELRARCSALGQTIQKELDDLAPALDSPDAEAAMAKFTPASSSQAQLLRLLKTIDYLHTTKDEKKDKKEEDKADKEDIFASFDFGSMWKQLSTCLSIVETKGSTDQIAIALLPLVEALMVICKYHSETGELFTSFTTAHRKVLNAIVRNKPTLLSGSFSLLVRNPRVLEFDNKRNWFFQQLKKKKDQVHVGHMHLNVRRQYVFEDSFHAIQRKSGQEFKYAKLNVKFTNEDGIDATGLTREWYSVLAKQIFDPNFALFEPCAADQQTYQPNKASGINGINPDHLSHFKFVGRVIGKSIYDGRLLDAYFNRAFYKQILGREVDMRDLESIDPEYHKSLQWMLDNDITGVIDQEFTIEDDQFGEKKVVELKEGGAKIPVTEENKQEYVRLVVSYRLDNSIKQQIKAFLDGFYDIIPQNLVQIFEPDQLELLISGITQIDVDELKNSTQMAGYKSTDPEINWFWRALRSFSQEERSRFLMFVTSSSRVPLGGFTQLQGASGTQPMQIQKLYSKDGGLPQASTCFNLLLLPKYESYEQLRDKLVFAMTETSGFGKA